MPLARCWSEARDAFAAYGKQIAETPSPARAKAARARVRESPGRASPLADAVHGYVAYHLARESGNGFDPMAHLTPETVFRASNTPKYLEAFDAAVAGGRSPPFRPGADFERDLAILEAMEREHGGH